MRFLVGICLASSLCCTPVAAAPRYEGSLLLDMDASADGRHAKLLQPYAFIDGKGVRWDVPKNAVVDGASIPQMFWSLVGGPFEGKYRNASVIHDWFCDRRTRRWQDVDRMFYEAMITSGVSAAQAKIMYLAVVWGGPRWDEQTIHNAQLPASERPPRNAGDPALSNRQLINAAFTGTAPSVAFVNPSLKERFNSMVTTVAMNDLSLDEIDQLAEQDPGNLIVPASLPAETTVTPTTTASQPPITTDPVG